MISFQGWEY